MNIDYYEALIKYMPVREQCFTTKRKTWLKAEGEIPWLSSLNDKLFAGQETLSISRQDIFETKNSLRELILKTIYWGYTNGMRGNHFINIMKEIETLIDAFKTLKAKKNLTTNDFSALAETLKEIKGLGLSTYSKLLYFLEVKFNETPCLILDQRLMDVFNSKYYNEYLPLVSSGQITESNRESKYLHYLDITNKIATNLGTQGENIEQFLFTFGNNLQLDHNGEHRISTAWTGNCPESLLNGKNVRMRLNSSDFFESEETGLQICLSGMQAIILNFRGKGKFRSTPCFGDEIEKGEILSPQNIGKQPFNNPTEVFVGSVEIERYIKGIKI